MGNVFLDFKNYFCLLAIFIILAFLTFKLWLLGTVFISFNVWLFWRVGWKHFGNIFFLGSLFLFLIWVSHFLMEHYFAVHSKVDKFEIIKDEYKYYLIKVNNNFLAIIYKTHAMDWKIHDIFYGSCHLEKVNKNNLWYYSLNIKYIINKYHFLGKPIHHFHLRNLVLKYFNEPRLSHNFIYNLGILLVFNIKTKLNIAIYKWAIKYNCVQLFVISGLHLIVLIQIFEWAFHKIKFANFIICLILFLYIWSLNFSLPATRYFLSYFFSFIFIKFKTFSKFDNWGLTSLAFIIVNPHIVFNISFQFVFFITLTLLFLFNSNLKNCSYLLQLFSINLCGFCSALILLVIWHLNFNVLGFFISIILIIFIEILYLFFWFFIYFKFLFCYFSYYFLK